jgi:UDP-N-acetyl-2-amino-2-deoxyglucuronate dehydrogenase
MDEIRVAVMGAGGAGRGHARTYAKLDGVKLVAVNDVNEERGKPLADELGARLFLDYHEMIETLGDDIDAVSIVLPHKFHADAALTAFAAGKHVLIEKPMCVTIAEADQMIAAAERAGVRLMVGFSHRFHTELITARRLINDGELGKIAMAIDYMSFGGDAKIGSWNWNKELGAGGMMIYNSVHGADRLCWLLGANVEEVYGHMGTYAHQGDTEDNAVATLRFDNGVIGSMITNFCPFELPNKCDLDIYGTKGAIRIKTWESITFSNERTTFTQTRQRDDHFRAEIQEFIDSIREHRQPAITGHDGKISLAIILAFYQSVTQGRPVRLSEIL